MTRDVSRRGFTMIELLVVIVIVGILAVALAPAVNRFRSAGEDTVSRNNLMRLGRAAIAYRSDHDNCYPAAGGYFSSFSWTDGTRREKRYGRARGWVYFEHNCPRSKGDEAAADKIGDGNHDGWGLGGMKRNADESDSSSDTYVNEEGCCICFDSKTDGGGISAKPAGWQAKASDTWSQAQVAIMNGALYEYLGKDLRTYTNPTFEKLAVQKLKVSRSDICRAYAMNIVTGADKELYETRRSGYNGGGPTKGGYGIRYGQQKLRPYVDTSSRAEAMPARLVLFVELDLENSGLRTANSLEGDQVWDWDAGDESMGFNHENNGAMYAHVCFADGHVEAIRDPSQNIDKPDEDKRLKLSKWYGSGGVNANGQKLD